MDNNKRRYLNVLRKMNIQNEEEISQALKQKGFYSQSDSFPLSALHFELTSSCNVCCKHCYNKSGGKNTDRMTPEEWLKFSKYLVRKGGLFECLISGGEPFLLGEKLYEILDILDDDGTIFMLMTNGTMINEDKATRLKKYRYHWFQLSIDGADSVYHDWFRGQVGCWDKAVNAAKLISKNGIPLKIAHCVTAKNLSKLDDMFELAYTLGASSVIAGGISLSGRAGENKGLLLDRNQERELWEKIKENRAKYDGRMSIKTTNEVKSGLLRHAEKPRSNAVIRPNGDVRIDDMAPFVIGNILDEDFESIWENKIDKCWKDSRVIDYINGFDADDRNFETINYLGEDVFI